MMELLIVVSDPASAMTPELPFPWIQQLSIIVVMRVDPLAGRMKMPLWRLFRMVVPVTKSWPPVVRASRMAVPASVPWLARKPKISQFSTYTARAARIRMPQMPVPAPLIERFRSVMTSAAPALMMMPLVRLARIEANPDPSPPSRVMPLVIVTAPKPPGSMTLISPPAAVFEIAPANVLHGAVRLQGLTSSPTPDTHVLVACAWVIEAVAKTKTKKVKIFKVDFKIFMGDSPNSRK